MSVPAPRGPRLRELGLRIGRFDPGAANAITDVTGVTVGHATVWRDEPEPPEGRGIARTGVTAVLPASIESLFAEPVPAGVAVLNGAGELTGSLAIAEWGLLETPVYLTSTHAVGRVYDGAVEVAVAADSAIGYENVVIPVVGECDDSWLSDARVAQIEAADVGRAVASAAGGAVDEGAIGAGTGMLTKGYKAGVGTASRIAPSVDAAVGVLVLANFDAPPQLVVDGVHVGEALGAPPAGRRSPAGSCLAVVAVDAPLVGASARAPRAPGRSRPRPLWLDRTPRQRRDLRRVRPVRAASTWGGAGADVPDGDLNDVFEAAVDATEEAVLNALWAAPEVAGREGRIGRALPHDDVLELLAAHGRLDA